MIPSTVIEAARQRIGRGERGEPTRGSWIREDGTATDVGSGRNTAWYEETRRTLIAIGQAAGDRLGRLGTLATHVEMQFVTRMKAEGLSHATLVLDREPCGVFDRPPQPFQCHAQLDGVIRTLLPGGATLTVIDPDGRVWSYPKKAGQGQ